MTTTEPIPFEELAAKAPKHDPESCERAACARCRPQGKPAAPEIEPNPHHAAGPSDKHVARVDRFVAAVTAGGKQASSLGVDAWFRAASWVPNKLPPMWGERGGGGGPEVSEENARIRREERVAGGYFGELGRIYDQVEALLARADVIYAICNPEHPRNLLSKEMQAAQVAADGWCVSCWRCGCWSAIATDKDGHRFYKDACRTCGKHRAEFGEFPPSEHVVARHEGRRVRVKA